MSVDSENLAKHCIQAAVGAAALCTLLFWGEWLTILFCWLMVFPMALLIGFLMGFVLNTLGVEMEQQSMWLDQGENVVERSENVVGKLGDLKIHEHIILKRPDNGELVKLYYDRVVNLQNEWEAPNKLWFVVEPGGILYVESAKEKAEAAVAAAVEASVDAEPENTSPVDRDVR